MFDELGSWLFVIGGLMLAAGLSLLPWFAKTPLLFPGRRRLQRRER